MFVKLRFHIPAFFALVLGAYSIYASLGQPIWMFLGYVVAGVICFVATLILFLLGLDHV